MLVGILGTPWSMQDGRVEVDPNPFGTSQNTSNGEPRGGGWTDNDEIQKRGQRKTRICITKRVVSEFGAAWGCRCALKSDNCTQKSVERGSPPRWNKILRTRSDSKNTRPRGWSWSGRPRATCCLKKQRPTSAHGKTPLWRHKCQKSHVDLRAARLGPTWKGNQVATTTWSAYWSQAQIPFWPNKYIT